MRRLHVPDIRFERRDEIFCHPDDGWMQWLEDVGRDPLSIGDVIWIHRLPQYEHGMRNDPYTREKDRPADSPHQPVAHRHTSSLSKLHNAISQVSCQLKTKGQKGRSL